MYCVQRVRWNCNNFMRNLIHCKTSRLPVDARYCSVFPFLEIMCPQKQADQGGLTFPNLLLHYFLCLIIRAGRPG